MNKNDIFKSSNNDIIIEMNRIERKGIYNIYPPGFQYECILRFKNNLGILIKELRVTEIEILKLIDNIYSFLELNEDILFSFNSINQDYTTTILKLSLEVYDNTYLIQFFRLFSSNGEELKPIISFDISDNIIDLINKLYYTFIVDSSIDNIDIYNPEYIINQQY